jgi:hypothetical protein
LRGFLWKVGFTIPDTENETEKSFIISGIREIFCRASVFGIYWISQNWKKRSDSGKYEGRRI